MDKEEEQDWVEMVRILVKIADQRPLDEVERGVVSMAQRKLKQWDNKQNRW